MPCCTFSGYLSWNLLREGSDHYSESSRRGTKVNTLTVSQRLKHSLEAARRMKSPGGASPCLRGIVEPMFPIHPGLLRASLCRREPWSRPARSLLFRPCLARSQVTPNPCRGPWGAGATGAMYHETLRAMLFYPPQGLAWTQLQAANGQSESRGHPLQYWGLQLNCVPRCSG